MNNLFRCTLLAVAVVSVLGSVEYSWAQPQSSSDGSMLTLDRLFAQGEFKDRSFGPFKWSQHSATYFKLEAAQAGVPGRDLVRYHAASGEKDIVVTASQLVPRDQTVPLVVEDFALSADESRLLIYTQSKRVWRLNTRGDYWVLDIHDDGSLRKLGGDAAPSTLMFAKFSPDGNRVAYVCKNNIYIQDLSDMAITAVTSDGSDLLINGTSDWVNEEELQIRDAFRWNPDGSSILFWQFDTSGVQRFQLINNTDQDYPTITSFPYPKVGETNSATRIGVVDAKGGEIRWLDLPSDPREHYLPHAEWTPDGKGILIQQLNRLQNTNRVMYANGVTGEVRVVHTEADDAWLENDNPIRWLKTDQSFLWLSERSGWREAYEVDVEASAPRQISHGNFDLIQIDAVDNQSGWLYYSASPDNPTQHYLYRQQLNGGTPERLSPIAQPGWHSYDIAPNCDWAIHTYSTFTSPPLIELVKLPEHQVVRVLENNQQLRENLARLDAPKAEFLKLDIGEGVELDACCLSPSIVSADATYPLLIHVYGEPASQSVRDKWPGERGLWHWMLAQQGYIVAIIENRGTPVPRGRSWRKAAFRKIGILAPDDQARGVRAILDRWSFVDPRRIGIWGWSGGGSMSLNAIFRFPDLYSTAIAVAPNPSQLLYDTIYQERYMGLPEDNAENYRLGSPITHASQLQGNLLLIHGTGDDNCHYQGTERLMNELILNNKFFTAVPYPNRSHSISEGTNTVRHLYGTLTQYLHQHLPVNPIRVSSENQ